MPLRVLIVPDKFKGTLTAAAAAAAIGRGWRQGRPADRLELLPMSDGGDGFGEVMSAILGAKVQTVKTCDAAHRPCTTRWWWQGRSRTAVIESAGVIGLAMLPPGRYHPFELDTFGLGTVVRAALARGTQRLIVGLGGSATNDGGFGMARALGWSFRSARGEPIERWTDLSAATEAHPPPGPTPFNVVVAVDVQNRLLGQYGASRIYGPQKGLRSNDFFLAEQCLRRLARLVTPLRRENLARLPGAGAAGGLGFGFAAFLGGRLEPGFELFAREVRLEARLREAELVLTGEGAIDASSFMGKGAGQIARACAGAKTPCIGLAGRVAPGIGRKSGFCAVHALTDLTDIDRAMAEPAAWLERLAETTARGWTDNAARRPSAHRSQDARELSRINTVARRRA